MEWLRPASVSIQVSIDATDRVERARPPPFRRPPVRKDAPTLSN
jgi:hypothetical protein